VQRVSETDMSNARGVWSTALAGITDYRLCVYS